MHFTFRQQLLVVLFTASSLLLAGCSNEQPRAMPSIPEVTIQTVVPKEVPITMELVGETAGYRDIEVRARVGGILLKRTYVEGQPVKQGQVLFQIDPAPYQVMLEQAKGAQAQQQAALDKATADRDRIAPLYRENAISKMDFDNASSAYNVALAAKQSADAKVKEAQLNLDYTHVTAPISGMTSKQVQSEGSLIRVDAAEPLTTISQFDPLYVNFSISEQSKLDNKRNLREGTIVAPPEGQKTVKIRLSDGHYYSQAGKIDFHDNRVDPKTGTIRTRAMFANPNGDLLPGQFVRVLVDIGIRNTTITVPEQAIMPSQADNLILTVDGSNKVVSNSVQLGQQIGGEVVIESGLKAGDRVIINGGMKARAGDAVTPVADQTTAQIPAQSTTQLNTK
ncbi:efflux RND transporter periplasmic adaptor subunit [Solimicrobium silvestre]|uniref:Efflux transporter, RND family, MFP subunit n=1 Tax=Solimicrobium silvestre TaxID=2099400 RepID=A0A2S9GU86_9BURK|nr:efflux RND transporter periplasmic adaptor subunit [Solimicrobium silvestre]PRC91261.1 Efflux transporter, RND family, MFP subunit [Solimicrobium silvestre]